MKKLLYVFIILGLFTLVKCEKEYLSDIEPSVDMALRAYNSKTLKTTGDVEVEFYAQMGERHQGPHNSNGIDGPSEPGENQEGELKRAYVTFDAHTATYRKPARGSFTIRMVNRKDVLKREIIMAVDDVLIDPENKEAWFSGIVLVDERFEIDGDDHGGGCNHDTEGGCDHDDSGDCGGDDHGGGAPMNREGQILNVYIFDGGTPGINGDYIGWKWGNNNEPHEPHDPHDTPHIFGDEGSGNHRYCEKPIIGGNLTVFTR